MCVSFIFYFLSCTRCSYVGTDFKKLFFVGANSLEFYNCNVQHMLLKKGTSLEALRYNTLVTSLIELNPLLHTKYKVSILLRNNADLLIYDLIRSLHYEISNNNLQVSELCSLVQSLEEAYGYSVENNNILITDFNEYFSNKNLIGDITFARDNLSVCLTGDPFSEITNEGLQKNTRYI